MDVKFYFVFVSGFVPLIVGFIWYNPKVFGNVWMQASGMTPEVGKRANMPLIFALTYLFSVMLSLVMMMLTIHQMHIGSIFANDPSFRDPNSEIGIFIREFMMKHGSNFRTFKHGAFHGVIAALLFALPVLGINALFEQRGFKYIAVNTGYWLISLGLMGGIVCAFV
jgi:hypothetical protein